MSTFLGTKTVTSKDLQNVNTEELQKPIQDLNKQKNESVENINGCARKCADIARICHSSGDDTGIKLGDSWSNLSGALKNCSTKVDSTLTKFVDYLIAYTKETQANEAKASAEMKTIDFEF